MSISVITPTYNRAHLIGSAIDSVLKQGFEDWELLIVDDCSTDNTEETIKKYNDLRIRYIKLKKNKGNAGARNAGVKQAKGKYIFFLDSDDEMIEGALAKSFETAENTPGFKYGFGGYLKYDKDTLETKEMYWKPKSGVSFLEELKIGTGCGLFIKQRVFETVGFFDERIRTAVDTDWLIRLDFHFEYTLFDHLMVKVIFHSGERVRNNKLDLLNAYEIIWDKNKDIILKNEALLNKFVYKLMWVAYHNKKFEKGNTYYRKYLKSKKSLKPHFLFFIFNILPYEYALKLHYKLSH